MGLSSLCSDASTAFWVSIFLTTEDPAALEAFVEASRTSRPAWRVLHYAPAVSKRRSKHGMGSPAKDAMASKGDAGTHSWVALLLALNAKFYVLSTASSWSRLIDNARTSVVDRVCSACTQAIDLRPCDAHNSSSPIACG